MNYVNTTIKRLLRNIFQTGSFLFVSACYLLVSLFSGCSQSYSEISLAGQWEFREDPNDEGMDNSWMFSEFSDAIQLPGSMAENGKGDDISVDTHWTGNMWNDSAWYVDEEMAKYRQEGNVKVPFWLSPQKVYYGAAWYKKVVEIPSDWQDEQITLYLERPHWETSVWVGEKKVGVRNTLGTPHTYDLSAHLKPGKHLITIRVDNRIKEVDVGRDAHSMSDNTQTNWNGIVGKIKLIKEPNVALTNVQLYPNVRNGKVVIEGSVKATVEFSEALNLQVFATSNTTGQQLPTLGQEIKVDAGGNFDLVYDMGENPELWDEFSPNLYTMTLQLSSMSGLSEEEVVFGMRDFKVDGKHFSINDRPVFLRGTLECAIFPLTGYPPTDVANWKRIFSIIKNHGLNHMRFHSWCPPEAAFVAADELGVYLQVEASAWTTVGDGKPIDQWVYREAEGIIRHYGNHPSFVMMAYGNEPSGKNQNEYLTGFVDHMKALDSRRLYTSGAGWPFLENLDFYNHKGPRIQGWAQELNSVINAEPPQTILDYDELIQQTPMPYVSHEMGQWCVYPNFGEMSKYKGVLQPKNFEIFKEALEENQMAHLADSFHLASGKLQAICYKADIEAALRTKDMAGFQLLDLHDFPGQGTALVGILDPFWDSKDYITPEEFKQFNDVTVPLARLPKRIFTNNETLLADIEVAHYGPTILKQETPSWRLVDDNQQVFADGYLKEVDVPIGNGKELGTINVALGQIKRPTKLNLEVDVSGEINTWDIWVYPQTNEEVSPASDFQVVDELSGSTIHYLENGGRVLLNVSKGAVKPMKGGDIGVGFSSIFWNTSWTKGQKPHTLGILCNPEHPALAEFPSEYHSNWQWWDAMSHSNAIVLDDFSPDLNPIVRIIDDWFENRRTALIFEAKVGKGKLLISGVDLHSNLENRPEARQLRYSLERYVGSDLFDPKIALTQDQLKDLFVE